MNYFADAFPDTITESATRSQLAFAQSTVVAQASDSHKADLCLQLSVRNLSALLDTRTEAEAEAKVRCGRFLH